MSQTTGNRTPTSLPTPSVDELAALEKLSTERLLDEDLGDLEVADAPNAKFRSVRERRRRVPVERLGVQLDPELSREVRAIDDLGSYLAHCSELGFAAAQSR